MFAWPIRDVDWHEHLTRSALAGASSDRARFDDCQIAGDGPRALDDVGQHASRQAAGEGVLLAGMERSEHEVRSYMHFALVAEARPRPKLVALGRQRA